MYYHILKKEFEHLLGNNFENLIEFLARGTFTKKTLRVQPYIRTDDMVNLIIDKLAKHYILKVDRVYYSLVSKAAKELRKRQEIVAFNEYIEDFKMQMFEKLQNQFPTVCGPDTAELPKFLVTHSSFTYGELIKAFEQVSKGKLYKIVGLMCDANVIKQTEFHTEKESNTYTVQGL